MPQQQDNQPNDEDKIFSFCVLFLIVVSAIILILATCTPAHAETINMNKIMMIESGGRNINSSIKSEHAIGIFQITPILLKEYNFLHSTSYTRKDLFDKSLNYNIANWYLNVRIPQMLKANKKPVNVRSVLIAYNAGISYIINDKTLPAVTVRYLRKYGA